jgi:hypothetical protein
MTLNRKKNKSVKKALPLKKNALKKTASKKPFDKYYYYINSVQAPEHDVVFMRDTYRSLRGKAPVTMREDFCGTHALSCEWTKLNSKNVAFGVDLDSEPIAYGQSNYVAKLSGAQRARLQVLQADVLNPSLPKADIICAMNFSHFIFKDRSMMKSYFHNALTTLNESGILLIDCFGGPACQRENEEVTKLKNFNYYWHQRSFDPVSQYAVFNIHYKPNGQPKVENAFTYDWRMWSIPELREMMSEVGFQKTHVYWEGTTRAGEGDGKFTKTETGEECLAWIAYIVGQK